MREVKLGWAIGPDGEFVTAASMVGVEPANRPRVTCPCCEESVTIRAGERGIVAPHVAHPPGSTCAVTNPETAEHMNAKLQIVLVLNQRNTLRLRVRCTFGHVVEADWCVPPWKRAVPEFRVGTRRPDVALFDNDNVVAAVEVLRSHSVDRAKSEDLAASGVPWVEVRASQVLSWDGDSALLVETGDLKSLRELVRQCPECYEMDYPTGDPIPPEELARQCKEIRAELKKLKPVKVAATPSETDRYDPWIVRDKMLR